MLWPTNRSGIGRPPRSIYFFELSELFCIDSKRSLITFVVTVLRRRRLMISDELFDSVEISQPVSKLVTAKEHNKRWITGQIFNEDDQHLFARAREHQDNGHEVGRQMDNLFDAESPEHTFSPHGPRHSTHDDSLASLNSFDRGEPSTRPWAGFSAQPNFHSSNPRVSLWRT